MKDAMCVSNINHHRPADYPLFTQAAIDASP